MSHELTQHHHSHERQTGSCCLRVTGGGVRRSVSADVSDVSVDSVPLGYKLQDLMDVQVMARLQEESKCTRVTGFLRCPHTLHFFCRISLFES